MTDEEFCLLPNQFTMSGPMLPEKVMQTSSQENRPRRFLNAPLRWLILFLFLVGFLIFAYGAMEARKTSSNRVVDWFPSSFQETRKCQWFWGHFGTDELLMISWEGLATDDPIQEMVAAHLTASPGKDASGNPLPSFFTRVMTTHQMLDELEKVIGGAYDAQNLDPPQSPRKIAAERLDGWLISRDRQSGCIVAIMSLYGAEHRAEALKKVYDDTMRLTGLTHQQIHIAGSSCDSVAIDEASKQSQEKLLPIFGLVCLILLALCMKNCILTFTILAIAMINEEFGPAMIFFTGSHMDSISLLISALVFVLTLECGIHLANYYRDAVREKGDSSAVMSAIEKGWLPCFLATFTTVLGMGSLAISHVTPIRNFGIYSALALSMGTFFLFLYLPSFWENWPPYRYTLSGIRKSDRETQKALQKDHSGKIWRILASFISRTYAGIILLFLLLLGGASLFIFDLKTTVSIHGMLPRNNEVIVDYNYLEKKVGGLVPLEVVIRIPKKGNESRNWLEQCELVKRVETALTQVPDMDGSMSMLNFLPDLPELRERGTRAAVIRRRSNTILEENMEKFRESGYFYEAPEEKLWRISVRVPAWKRLDYEPLLKKLECVVYETFQEAGVGCRFLPEQLAESPYLIPIAEQFQQSADDTVSKERLPFVDVSTVVTGAVPLVFQAQKQLLKDLIDSFFMAFVLITLTLIFLLRGILPGLIAMLPNIFPSIFVFGILAWWGLEVDIGSMMTASVALGITVDGTLHFLTWFQRGIREGRGRCDAVIYAYTHCAKAMLQTAFICGFAFLVFSFSGFIPVSRFAWMLCILLTVAVITDLFLTPALLISPLGRVFVSRKNRQTPPSKSVFSTEASKESTVTNVP
ncbi:MAG: MMPL family transporter [Planctomycetia bacterium]|nr:MMPL family transporter [Planctomycetia bacterium]